MYLLFFVIGIGAIDSCNLWGNLHVSIAICQSTLQDWLQCCNTQGRTEHPGLTVTIMLRPTPFICSDVWIYWGGGHFVKISSEVPKPWYFQRVLKYKLNLWQYAPDFTSSSIWSNASSTTKTYTIYCTNMNAIFIDIWLTCLRTSHAFHTAQVFIIITAIIIPAIVSCLNLHETVKKSKYIDMQIIFAYISWTWQNYKYKV